MFQPGAPMNFNGLAGNQVLEWANLDSEIKTAGLKNVSPHGSAKTTSINIHSIPL